MAALALFAFLLFVPGLFTTPPVDRDEARFAQASRQMIETGNLVDIRFQGEPRYKKPIGIYWLQAASAKVFGESHIWAYRLPSLLGAIAAVVLAFWVGKPLIGSRGALIGAAFLAASLLLNVEARLAKTDAVLLATILGSFGVLARAWMSETISLRLALVFWASLGVGILVKGPIAPMVLLLTIFPLGMVTQKWNYLKALRPVVGLALTAAIVAPWVIAISIATHGAFFTTAISGDLAPKLAGGQESHGAPPGTYLALMLVTFWPGVLVLGPAFAEAYKARKTPIFAFLLYWAVPTWFVFEIIPTKLPHYVLPVYPALALMCGAWAAARIEDFKKMPLIGWAAIFNFVAVAIVLGLALMLLRPIADHVRSPLDALVTLTLLLATAFVVRSLLRKDMLAAMQAALGAALIAVIGAFGLLLPSLTSPWMSPRIVALLPHDASGVPRPLISSGFSEPSLIFLSRTDTRLVPPKLAVKILKDEPGTVAAIASWAEQAFQSEAQNEGVRLAPLGTVSGFNYSVGKPMTVTLFERVEGP